MYIVLNCKIRSKHTYASVKVLTSNEIILLGVLFRVAAEICIIYYVGGESD